MRERKGCEGKRKRERGEKVIEWEGWERENGEGERERDRQGVGRVRETATIHVHIF